MGPCTAPVPPGICARGACGGVCRSGWRPGTPRPATALRSTVRTSRAPTRGAPPRAKDSIVPAVVVAAPTRLWGKERATRRASFTPRRSNRPVCRAVGDSKDSAAAALLLTEVAETCLAAVAGPLPRQHRPMQRRSGTSQIAKARSQAHPRHPRSQTPKEALF